MDNNICKLIRTTQIIVNTVYITTCICNCITYFIQLFIVTKVMSYESGRYRGSGEVSKKCNV